MEIELDRELFYQMMRGVQVACDGVYLEREDDDGVIILGNSETLSVGELEVRSALTLKIQDAAHRLADLTAGQSDKTVKVTV